MKRKNYIGYIHESMNVRDKKSTRTKSELVEQKTSRFLHILKKDVSC